VEVVQGIWMAAEQPCGKRLAEALPLWLSHYQRRYGKLLTGQRKLADQVSAATLDRLLQPARTPVTFSREATRLVADYCFTISQNHFARAFAGGWEIHQRQRAASFRNSPRTVTASLFDLAPVKTSPHAAPVKSLSIKYAIS
jgi:hypothetical protein